jgi:hypothetical protein
MSFEKRTTVEGKAQSFLRQFLFSEKSGGTLVEVLLLIGVFALLSVGVLSALITSSFAAKQGMEYVVAAGYIDEGIQSVRSIRDRDYATIANGSHGLDTASGYYEFSGTSDSLDGGVFTRTVTIEDVYRIGGLSGDIAATGVLDANSKKVTVNVHWDTRQQKTQNIDAVFYVVNWGVRAWLQTLTTDFEAGSINSTAVVASGNGEIELSAHDANWSGIAAYHTLDLDGTGDRIALWHDDDTDLLYVLSTPTTGNEFFVLDTSDVTNTAPPELRGIDLSGLTASDFVVHDGYAYIASNADSAEVTVVDTMTMTQVNTIDLTGSEDATGIDANGTTLVISRDVAAASEEIEVYDISTPAGTISRLGGIETGTSLTDIVTDGSYTYASSDENLEELVVGRLSDYTNVNSLDITGTHDLLALELVGTDLYAGRVNGGNDDLYLLDVSTPETVLPITSSLELQTSVYDIDVDRREEFAVLATDHNNKEALIVNLSTFTEASFSGTSGIDDGFAAEIFGSYIYLGTESDDEDVMVLGIASGWYVPQVIGTVDKSGNHDVNTIYIDSTFAFLGADQSGSYEEFYIYDISTPSSPTYLSALEVGSTVSDIVVSGNYAYLATGDNSAELTVVDISTKTSPSIVGGYDTTLNSDALSVEIEGTTVFLGRAAGSGHEFYSIDVSTPSSPSLLDSVELSYNINALVSDGTEVYAATDDNSQELWVVDVSTPATLSALGGHDLGGASPGLAIALSGDMLALGRQNSTSSEFVLFDVSTPASPSVYSETEAGSSVNGVDYNGGTHAYLATDDPNEEFQRWSVDDPTMPFHDSSYDLGANGNDVWFDNTYAYIVGANDSLEMQIMGPGTASSDYAPEGTLTSQPYDSGQSTTSWAGLGWYYSGSGTIKFRVRTADSEANLETALWVGDDGTADTTYDTPGLQIVIDPGATGTEWMQWKAYLYDDRTSTPVIEDVYTYYREQ